MRSKVSPSSFFSPKEASNEIIESHIIIPASYEDVYSQHQSFLQDNEAWLNTKYDVQDHDSSNEEDDSIVPAVF